MTADSLDASSLDERTIMLVRLGALVAVDAPAASYLLNLGAANEVGVQSDQVQGVLAAVAPIVGTPRVAAAGGNIVRALGIASRLAELELGESVRVEIPRARTMFPAAATRSPGIGATAASTPCT